MIIIFGGTTEGRTAAAVTDNSGKNYFYSTKSELQDIQLKNGRRIAGALNESDMQRLIEHEDIRLIIDAAHPFAVHLHATIARVATRTKTPVIRFDRKYSPHQSDICYCKDYDEAIALLKSRGIERLLALTGVNTIEHLLPFWSDSSRTTYFRILKREGSITKAHAAGFPDDRLLYYNDDNQLPTTEEEVRFFKSLNVQAILTKESGLSGGTDTKIEAGRQAGLKIFVVCHPAMPDIEGLRLTTVTGPHGLRRAIETLLPSFFALRTGFTTGTCATAATHAAIHAILTKEISKSAHIILPDGEEMAIPVDEVRLLDTHTAWAEVKKDAGSDPDVTDGCRIQTTVKLREAEHTSVSFLQGKGVGTVTLPGLGIEVGEPAINPTPRRMIEQDLENWTRIYGHTLKAEVTIEVKDGEQLATRTFNPRVGVVGGISIIGTSGIVKPFSNEAFIESIGRQVNVALAVGAGRIAINSGAKSETCIKKLYPDLPPQAFIHYGNFIGDTLKIICEYSRCETGDVIPVTLGMMLGKAVKLAAGHLTTHSHIVTMDKDFLQKTATEAGCTQQAAETIARTSLARTLWKDLTPDDLRKFMTQLLVHCRQTCSRVFPTDRLTIVLIAEDGTIFTADDTQQ